MRFICSLHSETVKLVTMKVCWVSLVAVAGMSLLAPALLLGMVNAAPGSPLQLGNPEHVLALSNIVGATCYAVPLGIGAVLSTADLSHRTFASALLAEPSRVRLFLAKGIVGLAYGAVLGLIAAGIGLFGLVLGGQTAALTAGLVARQMVMVVTFAIWAAMGVGLGFLVQSTAAVVAGVLLFTQFIEPVVRISLNSWSKFDWLPLFPGVANDAALGSSLFNLATGGPVGGVWLGIIVLLCYAVGFLIGGGVRAYRYEIK